MNMNMPTGWQLMQDAVVFAEFDHQGGTRGGNQLVAPNWWMGMASRGTSRGQFTFTGMLSLDPATSGRPAIARSFRPARRSAGAR
jgi:hypothetical protein